MKKTVRHGRVCLLPYEGSLRTLRRYVHEARPVPRSGRAQVHAAPTGTEYLVITNGSRFVVLDATAASHDLQGHSVAIARDAMGQWSPRQTPDRGLE